MFWLPRAWRSLQYAMHLVDPSRQSRTYEIRLAKYVKRGFSIAIPGFDRKQVSMGVYTKSMKDLNGLAKVLRLEMLDLLRRHAAVNRREWRQKLSVVSPSIRQVIMTAPYQNEQASQELSPLGWFASL